jgi:hypothetical protein
MYSKLHVNYMYSKLHVNYMYSKASILRASRGKGKIHSTGKLSHTVNQIHGKLSHTVNQIHGKSNHTVNRIHSKWRHGNSSFYCIIVIYLNQNPKMGFRQLVMSCSLPVEQNQLSNRNSCYPLFLRLVEWTRNTTYILMICDYFYYLLFIRHSPPATLSKTKFKKRKKNELI